MEQTRFEQGIEQLRKIDGIGGENVIKSLEDIAPDVGKYIIEFAFGDIYPRKELNCQTAHCGRCKPHFDFGRNTSPIVPYRYLPQTFSGTAADCRRLV